MEKNRSILENDFIILRKPEPEDLDFLFNLENNTDYWFLSDTKSPFSKWQIKQHIEHSVYDIFTNKELRLIIELKENRQPVGIVDLFEFDPIHDRAGIGILIKKEFQRAGIATQAIELTLKYSFKILNLNLLWCNIDNNNIESIKLFEKFNFKKCGELKEWKKKGKSYSDVFIFQLLKTTYNSKP